MGVTAQTIRNWADREGMPVAFTDPKTGARWFDLGRVEAWKDANKVGGDGPFSFGRGGRREGAGRKAKFRTSGTSGAGAGGGGMTAASMPPPPDESDVVDLLAMGREPVKWTLTGAMVLDQATTDLPSDQRRKLATIAMDPTADLATPTAAKIFQVQTQASLLLAKQRHLTGRLVDRDEAASEWEKTLTVLAKGLENLPRRLTPKLMPLLLAANEHAAGQELSHQVRVRMETLVRAAVDELRVELVREVESGQVRRTG